MKRLVLFASIGAVFGFAVSCASGPLQTSGNPIGTHDMVFIDQFVVEGGLVAKRDYLPDGGDNFTGLLKNLVYVTSADTNEVRALQMFTPNGNAILRRQWVRAPNPLETLSIPTLDRPTMLATEFGMNSLGQQVTSTHVFASHPGASELSIVSSLQQRQLSGKPVPLPGPMSAMAGLLDVVGDTLPASGALYFSTWDGTYSSLFKIEIPRDDDAIEAAIASQSLRFTRVQLVEGAAMNALFAVSPLSIRTLDGAPFCNAEMCLAVSIRQQGGMPGRSFLLEPSTGRQAMLGFPGPVRQFASGEVSSSLYAVLDEVACGGASCGGVVGVDLRFATSIGGFPRAIDALNRPFIPVINGSTLVTGVDVAQNWPLQTLVDSSDGGPAGFPITTFAEVGVITTSDGFITFFSGVSGSVIDYDGRRAVISSAVVRLPFTFEDGGKALFDDDGGAIGAEVAASVSSPVLLDSDGGQTIPWRVSTVTDLNDAGWVFDISDGYLADQQIIISNKGPVPGLVSIVTSPAAGLQLATAGFEARASVGDAVQLATGDPNVGYIECGRTPITAIGAGFIEIGEVPVGCENRSLFSVYAGSDKSQVVTAGLEGYLGRGNPGEQITYNRPLIIVPSNVTSDRTALTITLSPNPLADDGAYIVFTLAGHVAPYRFTLETRSGTGQLSDCVSSVPSQVLLGPVEMNAMPFSPASAPNSDYVRRLFTIVQSGNALLEVRSDYYPSPVAPANSQSAVCWR